MGSASLSNLIASICDETVGTLVIRNTEGKKIQCNCIYQKAQTPDCFIAITTEILPENCRPNDSWALHITNESGEQLILDAVFVKQIGPKTFELKGIDAIDPTSLRQYFRVSLTTEITLDYSLIKAYNELKIHGKTLDISGNGVLAIFPEKPRKCHDIKIGLVLPHPKRTVSCKGHLVRIKALNNGNWQAALHFDDLANKDREDIIANCFKEQRRRIRENIQTAD